MKGFFSGTDSQKPEESKVWRTKKSSPKSTNPCDLCGLFRECKSPRMPVSGEGKKGILIVGEGPGRTEDERGRQFVGESGDLLASKLLPLGIDLYQDCWLINAVNCRPPGNRTPTKKEIKLCNPRLWDTIAEKKPRFILPLGTSAIDGMYYGRVGTESISRWRRLCIPDPKANAWVIPTYHPSFIIRNPKDKNLLSTWERDLTFAVSCLKKSPPEFPEWKSKIVMVKTEFDFLMDYLERLFRQKGSTIAFDYETSALQPYHPLSSILSCAITDSGMNCVAFPVGYPGAWKSDEGAHIKELLRLILGANHIDKIAHNFSFEEKWTRKILGTRIGGNRWCTENGAHVLDARQYFTGLKFQTFINFGIEGYDKELDPLKKGGTWPYNRMQEAPLEKLLLYNGGDALFTYWLWKKQKAVLTRKLDGRSRAFAHCMRGLKALDNASERGWCGDEFYYNDVDEELTTEIKKAEKRLLLGPEAKRFKEETGKDLRIVNTDFSPGDLRELFFKILNFKSKKKTAKAGNDAMDADVLSDIDHPFAKHILRRRKLVKLKNTYVANFRRSIINGRMHPTFNLHIARTYRSSAQDPNAQNVPTRDEEAKKYTRSGIIPSAGNRLMFADYGAVEVRILACYTLDKELVRYCNDPTTDMHRDEAQNIFLLTQKQVSKGLRQGSKNQFIFPEVYGSYWKNCARDLWHQNMDDGKLADGSSLKAHLKAKLFKGMPANQWQDIFGLHIKKVEEKFWQKYHSTREWQDKSVQEYLKKGYIEMLFGHRRGGYLSRNKIFNTPIQNTAFQCLLWAFYELDDLWERKKLRTQLIGQIHDEIVVDLFPPELEEAQADIQSVMSERIREEFPWIIVPLPTELSLTRIDGNWYGKVPYEPGGKLPEEK